VPSGKYQGKFAVNVSCNNSNGQPESECSAPESPVFLYTGAANKFTYSITQHGYL